uniref:Angiopoietin-4 n=1 Tax=Castor canadensis TaxID=51338 RepID=A0A8B7W532_CASCN|nr:angiopoietin-4 [Castor canadensis]
MVEAVIGREQHMERWGEKKEERQQAARELAGYVGLGLTITVMETELHRDTFYMSNAGLTPSQCIQPTRYLQRAVSGIFRLIIMATWLLVYYWTPVMLLQGLPSFLHAYSGHCQAGESRLCVPPHSALETRLQVLETQQQKELASLRDQKERLRSMLGRQNEALASLQRSLHALGSNSSLLQHHQHQLVKFVQNLVQAVAQGQGPASMMTAEQVFQDCAEIQRSGANVSGVYTIHVANMTQPKKVFCDMEANGGGWTLIQRRENGSVNFQRNWKDYKEGFGDPAGEHWLGNEVMHQLTSRAAYSLRVELKDWEGHEAYAQYERFHLGSEGQLYRLSLSGYSGSAGRQTSLALQDTNFSTSDADNDNCFCKCAQMMSGGWWFDACGLSNLNGIFYPVDQHIRKLNGIRWHYFSGPSYSLRATRMMMRPVP